MPVLPVTRSDEEWRAALTEDAYWVLHRNGTEPPTFSEDTPGQLEFELLARFGSKYPPAGGYRCAGCGSLLYHARSKFGSRCGWPSFCAAAEGAVLERGATEKGRGGSDSDSGSGGSKVELACASCGGHLGHVFRGEGTTPGLPTDERHCVNGLAITYDETADQPLSVPKLPPYLTLGAIPP